MKTIIKFIGYLISFIYPDSIHLKICNLTEYFITGWRSRNFKHFGNNSKLGRNIHIVGKKYIEIGDNVYIGKDTGLTAFCLDNS